MSNERTVDGEVIWRGAPQRAVSFAAEPRPGTMPGSPFTQAEWDELSAAMNEALSALNWAITKAKVIATATPTTGQAFIAMAMSPIAGVAALARSTPAETKAAVLDNLRILGDLAARRGPTGNQLEVRAGTLAPDKWLKGTKSLVDGVGVILASLNEQSTLATANQAMQSVSDEIDHFVDRMKKLGVELGGLSTIAIVGIVVVGLIILIPVVRSVLHAYATAPLKLLPSAGPSLGFTRRTKRRKRGHK